MGCPESYAGEDAARSMLLSGLFRLKYWDEALLPWFAVGSKPLSFNRRSRIHRTHRTLRKAYVWLFFLQLLYVSLAWLPFTMDTER